MVNRYAFLKTYVFPISRNPFALFCCIVCSDGKSTKALVVIIPQDWSDLPAYHRQEEELTRGKHEQGLFRYSVLEDRFQCLNCGQFIVEADGGCENPDCDQA